MIESKYTPLELESITLSELAHAYLSLDPTWNIRSGIRIERRARVYLLNIPLNTVDIDIT
jgi:hypothetical protein